MLTNATVRRVAAVSIAALGATLSVPARAEEPVEIPGPLPLSGPEVTLAETLYREGRRLMAEQHYAEACAKFAESHRLDPATGTLLNLATCHEAQGKLASAWLAFSEALRAARREQREDRVKFAEEHVRAIEPRLSHLTVEVTKTPDLDAITVKVDGFTIGPAAYGVDAPTDPGTHRVEAYAPGYEKWSMDVVVGGSADRKVVTVPALVREPVAPAPAVSPPKAVALRPIAPGPPPAKDEGLSPSRPITTAVYVTGAATLLLTGAAVVTGFTYVDRKSDYSTLLGRVGASRAEQSSARDDAKTFGWLNVGFTAGALLGAGVTALLYTTRPEQPRSGALPRLSAWVLPAQGGVALTSEF